MIVRVLLSLLACVAAAPLDAKTRIKDIATVRGVRANQLVGYGLVIGLNGTGDSLRNAPFTEQSVQSMLDRMGVNVRSSRPRTRNVAAVVVTAELPGFISRGGRIDVTVSSLGDATSLAGGSLVMTPLAGADETIYAVAQGPVTVSGFSSAGASERLTQGVPTAGRIANGGLVERDAPGRLGNEDVLALELHNPDFNTSIKVADAINAFSRAAYGIAVARENDMRSISLRRPRSVTPARFLAQISALMIVPEVPARVVIDERTGTIVIGADVTISTVAVSHGSLTVRVTETPRVSQPPPFSGGETVTTADTAIAVDQEGGSVSIVRGTNLQSLVGGLNRLGVKPPGIIAILQAIKTSGALHADLVVQ